MKVASAAQLRILISLATALFVSVGLALLEQRSDLVRLASNLHFDTLADRYANVEVAPNIRLVALDDRTIDDHGGEFPVKRTRHAQLLQGLTEVNAKSVTWDIVFRRETADDEILAKAFESPASVIAFGARPVLGQAKTPRASFQKHRIGPDDTSHWPALDMDVGLQPVPILDNHVSQLAHAAVSVGVDSIHRDVPLIVRVGDHIYPSLTLATIMVYYDLPRDDFDFDAPYLVIGPKTLEKPIKVPLDDRGHMLIRYVDDWRNAFFVQSYSTLNKSLSLFPEDLEEAFEDCIVLVGASYAGSGDFIATPIEGSVPGVLLTVNAVNTIVTGGFITPATHFVSLTVLLAMPFIVALLFALFRPFIAGPALIGLAGGLIGLSDYMFGSQSYFLPTFGAVAATVVSGLLFALVNFVRSYMAERKMVTVLRRFVAPSLITELEKSGTGRLNLQSRKRYLAIMFVDIAEFTKFSDNNDAQAVSEFLADFYDIALDILFRHDGTVDKLMGDGIIAYWGAPEKVEDKEIKAVRAGLELLEAFNEIAEPIRQKAGAALQLRVGINAGHANVGYFGGDRHAAYTIIGRSVNLASRLESNAPHNSVVIESYMYDAVKDHFTLEALDPIQAKGIAKPVKVWKVVGPKNI